MLDSGCSTCIVPISRLPKEAKKHVTHSDVHIKGINRSIIALNELHCNINIGNCDSPIFDDINVLVTTQDTPILIGQNILAYNTLDSYITDNQFATVEFRCTSTSGYTVHTAPIIPDSTSAHGPAYGALTIYNINQPTIGPQPNIQTPDQKLEASLNRFIYKDPIQVSDKVLHHWPQSTIAQSSNLPWIGDFKVIKTNDVMSQVQNANGDTVWIHRAHIRHLKPRPAHLSHIPPPPLYHAHQNTQDLSSSLPFELLNLTQNSILNNISSQLLQNETKKNASKTNMGTNSRTF